METEGQLLSGRIFVSGMMRSGTTLLQRCLDAHPEIQVEYQPNTQIIIQAKKRFLAEIGVDKYHVLAHYNPEPDYSFAEFSKWLLAEPQVLSQLVAHPSELPNQRYAGCKEVLAEEFYFSLLERGCRCINIVRDPRDVITSMSFGKGEQFTGLPRPVLFDLRNWRKSARFSYALRNHPNFTSIRFEDLILNPEGTLDSLLDRLELTGSSAQELTRNLTRSSWSGNSSFGARDAFDRGAIGGYRQRLPESVARYIEVLASKEMANLNYACDFSEPDPESVVRGFRDPFLVERDEFQANYSSTSDAVVYELNYLGSNLDDLCKELKL